ncbi:hypothetical protein CVT24_006733 [Panaeolus cyanescens]|uniref:Uncharacterized protein n=1 Tax=Panaeolus cyanescens TaxID=181874 RepID=A0A409V9I0_9AGAR|nr:hypothetical protein CVT24_006733 [Panaeolus cyanescens]
MSATAIASAPSLSSSGSSPISRNRVVTRNLSYPTRAAYPSFTSEEKPLRLFKHEECRISAPFRHMPDTPQPATVNPPAPAAQATGNPTQNGHQHTILGASWCLEVLKKLRTFGQRMFSQLTTRV